MTTPRMRRFAVELTTNVFVIVDLAVEYDDITRARRVHRLMTCRRQVDNGQPTLRQRDAGLGIRPDAVIVRTAMPDQVSHSPRDDGVLRCRSGAAEKADDSAHMAPSSIRTELRPDYYRRSDTRSSRRRSV
jgi:hypothetical protein